MLFISLNILYEYLECVNPPSQVKSFAQEFSDAEKKEIISNTVRLQEKTKVLIAATKQLNAAPQVCE